MKTFYWNKRPNFGDLLTPLLLKKFTKLPSEWSPANEAELVMVGSILDLLPDDFSGVVAGVGKLHEKTKKDLKNARILAVRGPLTAKGIKGDFVIGDPALLADELVINEDKQYNLGLVPHWTDTELAQRKEFLKFDPLIINVKDDPIKVISEIGRCKKIVSSSLHGIILADAFNIPRRIEIAPRMLTHQHQEGGLFKWEDYSQSINMKLEIGVTQEVDRHKILEKQFELFDVMEEIRRIFRPSTSPPP